MSLIQKGVRPSIPPSDDSFDLENLHLYQPAIEIYKKCSVLDASRRPGTGELKEMVDKAR